MIDVLKGPIRWINVAECHGNAAPEAQLGTGYRILCGVPISNLGQGFPRAKISAVLVKEFPIVGTVVDVRWKGEDHGTGVIGSLDDDSSLKSLWLEAVGRFVDGLL